MIVLERSEINRMRAISMLTVILSVAVLVSIGVTFSQSSDAAQGVLLVLGLAAVSAFVLSVVHLWFHNTRSQVILFHQGQDVVIAANHLHEGFKLRLFRDLLNDDLEAFSDDDRNRWSVLTREGFHPVLNVRNARKAMLLPICFMIFDDVFVFDHTQRWDHFDCANTSNPTYAARGVSPFKDDSVIPVRKETAVGTPV